MVLALGRILIGAIFIIKCVLHSTNREAMRLFRNLGGVHKEVDRTVEMKDLSI